tara:strand:+ start:64 stop:288 length:225 start_codon:yes stop_codon:yes gene_type:complete
MKIPVKSRTKGELIPSIIIEFHDLPDYYFSKGQWDNIGGYQGFLKSHSMSIIEIKKVHKLLLNPIDFPSGDWMG